MGVENMTTHGTFAGRTELITGSEILTGFIVAMKIDVGRREKRQSPDARIRANGGGEVRQQDLSFLLPPPAPGRGFRFEQSESCRPLAVYVAIACRQVRSGRLAFGEFSLFKQQCYSPELLLGSKSTISDRKEDQVQGDDSPG